MANTLTATSAHAVVGQPANDSFAFTAKLDIGGKHSCSAALVSPQWLVTAASCFADNPAESLKLPATIPKTIATIGRADLTGETGSVGEVLELVPREDRDLVLAKLAKPVSGIAPVNLGVNIPLAGEDLWVSGYGRTGTEWIPDRLHYAKFSVSTVKEVTVDYSAKTQGAAICQGDNGGPAFRDIGGKFELVGVNSRSWQGGCFGTDEKETRTGAVGTRVDDIEKWIRGVVSVPTPQPASDVPGDADVDFDGDGKADYLVVEDNGAVHAWLNRGGDTRGGWSDYGIVAKGAGAPGSKVRFADINGDGKADYLIVED
ncbi:trypsin-like serine protease, partial [Streptomyces roseifaciens]